MGFHLYQDAICNLILRYQYCILFILIISASSCGLPSTDIKGIVSPVGYTCHRPVTSIQDSLRIEFEVFNREYGFGGYNFYIAHDLNSDNDIIKKGWKKRERYRNEGKNPDADKVGFEYIIRGPIRSLSPDSIPTVGLSEILDQYNKTFKTSINEIEAIQRPFIMSAELRRIPVNFLKDSENERTTSKTQNENVTLPGTSITVAISSYMLDEGVESVLSSPIKLAFDASGNAQSDLLYTASCNYPITKLPCTLRGIADPGCDDE